MDKGDAAIAGLTIFSLVLGAALTIMLDLARGQMERKQRKQDRRDDFQHQTLIELQEAVYTNFRTMGQIHHEECASFRRTGKWGTQLIPDDLDKKQNETKIRANTLAVRVQDERVRELVTTYMSSTTAMIMANSERVAAEATDAAMKAHSAPNDRIGELLRSL